MSQVLTKNNIIFAESFHDISDWIGKTKVGTIFLYYFKTAIDLTIHFTLKDYKHVH